MSLANPNAVQRLFDQSAAPFVLAMGFVLSAAVAFVGA